MKMEEENRDGDKKIASNTNLMQDGSGLGLGL